MPPIPIYTESPITATKASGVTPQTATPGGQSDQDQGDNSSNNHIADAATPTRPPQNARYAPAQPTPTRTTATSGPPPPQPGAVPRLPVATATLPPPPRAGETYHPPEPTAAPAPQVPYPPQMAMPAPTTPPAYLQRGTMTGSAPGGTLPTQVTANPPGYQQNTSASGYGGYQGGGQNDSLLSSERNGDEDDEEGVWNSAVRWAQAAGQKLSAAESEVWRRINKE